MDLDNQAVESGLDTGNADGEVRNEAPAQTAGLSLKDSLTKAVASVTERAAATDPARTTAADTTKNAFGTSDKTLPGSLPGQAGSQEAAATAILEAPKHWPQKRRDAFGRFAVNQDAQKEWLDHTKEIEGEFTRKSQEHAEVRKFADGVRELFAPEQRALLQQSGKSEVEAIKWLLDLDGHARKDPAGYAKWFMQQAGLTPQQLFPEIGQGQTNAAGNPAESDWIDPELTKTREELGSLKAELAQLRQESQGYIQKQENARKTEVQNTIGRTIQKFVDTKDDAGNALYPHFNEVEDRMGWELSNNPELTAMPLSVEKLQKAYDLAVWANPATRQAMLDAQISSQQQEAAKRQAADKARAAQTLKPRVASNAGAVTVPPTDLKSMIRDAASRARG